MKPSTQPPSVALLYPGDRAARDRPDPAGSRFAAVFEALARAGIAAAPAVWHDDLADEVAAQLRDVALVQVWCNPIESGRRRDRLDALLRELGTRGVHVSAHPDTILRLGTKDVLVDTRELPFGSDAQRVDAVEQLASEVVERLRRGPRVLKQHRGHSGIGVWRVELVEGAGSAGASFRIRHAQRGSEEERVDLDGLVQRLAPYFDPANGGHMVDQPWQPRLAEGMVRAYLVGDRVTGFGTQAINALHPGAPGQPPPPPGPRLYHGADLPEAQELKRLLESQWVRLLRERVGVSRDRLPLLWDCDFMLGEREGRAAERYVLCEINVSSVSPFPPSSIDPFVAAVKALVGTGR